MSSPFSYAKERGRELCPLRSFPREAKASGRAKRESHKLGLISRETRIDIEREREFLWLPPLERGDESLAL